MHSKIIPSREEECAIVHTNIIPEFLFVGQRALYDKYIQANDQGRVFYFCILTNKKAEHKANENTNKMKDTLQESSAKKPHRTLIMPQE